MNYKATREPFSVLMSVYAKERPQLLDRAMRSVSLEQTLPPDEIILVEDGPLTEGLYEVVSYWKNRLPYLRTISYGQNRGLEYALNLGMKECSNEWIARMDSDDISVPERFERQMSYITKHPETDVLGCAIAEFEQDENNIVSLKPAPENIDSYIKFRSPVNHPTVFYRRSSVMLAGGYQTCRFMEDYHLWIRMHAMGMNITSLPDILYLFKMDRNVHKRRGGWNYVQSEVKVQNLLLSSGLISLPRYLFNLGIRSGARIIPPATRGALYKTVLRKRPPSSHSVGTAV